jgi:exopolysaccharide biosynthesis polyprenyl glycosylphosphotransferase
VHWLSNRRWLALAAALDAAGLVVLALLIGRGRQAPSDPSAGLLLVLMLLYWTFGWLFGSYTVLRRSDLRRTRLALRLGVTSAVSLSAAALLGWLVRAGPDVAVLHRGSLIPLFALLALWSALVRLAIRHLSSHPGSDHWRVLALPEEMAAIEREWGRQAARPALAIQDARAQEPPAEVDRADRGQLPGGLDGIALSPGVQVDPALIRRAEQLAWQGGPLTTLAEMAEQELQRIPPQWVGHQWLLFSGRIEGRQPTVERQLKRFADVAISLLLLLLAAPLLLLAAALIRWGDGGPVFYRQRRSGLMGEAIEVIKLRSMVRQAEAGGARWSEPNDQRITPVGVWLRRTRLDDLPQLLNVLRGEMSLIGPRPERPELEGELEQRIPHYRLRHWIRPGLSGWAQVNMPYSSSVEDAELKLSYDLYYLRNGSIWLDLLILAKTIKTVLKASGR